MIYLSVSQHRLTITKVRAVGFKIKIVVRIIYQYNYQPLGVELERKIKKYITIRTNIENLQGIGAFSGQISLQFEVVDADCVTVLINCNDDEPLPGACQLLETSLLLELEQEVSWEEVSIQHIVFNSLSSLCLAICFSWRNLIMPRLTAWPGPAVVLVSGSSGNVACL